MVSVTERELVDTAVVIPTQPTGPPEKKHRCGRCDYAGVRAELAEHAVEAEHPLCATCPRSLRNDEDRVCAQCIKNVRDDLTVIADSYAMLPDAAWHAGYKNSAIPGGNAMVLMAGGAVDGGGPDDHVFFKDPMPPMAMLVYWETDWRGIRGDRTALTPTVTSTINYLTIRLRWAADLHPDFDAFAKAIRDIRWALTHTVGSDEDPIKAPAECFECGGRLIRVNVAPKRDGKGRLLAARKRVNAAAKRAKPASVKERRQMVITAVSGTEKEGLTDSYVCQQCRTKYTWAQYAMALRRRADDTAGWVPVKLAAETARVTEKQVRRWIERGLIGCRCDVVTHRVAVWWNDVHDRAQGDDQEKAS